MNRPAVRCFYAIEPSCIECPWKDACQIYNQYFSQLKDILQLANDWGD